MPSLTPNKFGTFTGWNQLTCNLFGKDVEAFTKFSVSEKMDVENIYAAGNMPVGKGFGNYEASANITLKSPEFFALMTSVAPGKRIHDVTGQLFGLFESGSVIYKVTVHNVVVTNPNIEVSQGDKSIDIDLELNCSHITWEKV